MPITKDQWAQIKNELSSAYGRVKLQCDEYEVALQVERAGERRYQIITYVNGTLRGKWLTEDCEERRRFLQSTERFIFSPKLRNDMLKIHGGRRAKKADVEHINRKITLYQFHWSSVDALRRHFEKNNKDVTLIALGIGT